MHTLIITAVESLCMISIAWLIYVRTKQSGIIDVFWALNIMLMGMTHLLLQPISQLSILSLCLLILWATRLSAFLFITRIMKGEIDPRYTHLSQSWQNQARGFFENYLIQGVLAWILALPFFFISNQNTLLIHHILTAIIILLAIMMTAWADQTLYAYKRSGEKGLCEKGLWQYSRHPNYFFEWMVWLGFSILGIYNLTSLLSLLSAICLFVIMWKITLPLTEKLSLEKRPEIFADYQSRVPAFFPVRKLPSLLIFICVVQGISALNGYLTQSELHTWYTSLNKSQLTPPGFVFGIVWPLLYFCIAITGWRIFHKRREKQGPFICGLFALQLLLNWSWTPLFFSMHLIAFSLFVISMLFVLTSAIVYRCWSFDRLNALLLLPYLFWLGFATYLNFMIWLLN